MANLAFLWLKSISLFQTLTFPLVLLTRQSVPVIDRNEYAHFSNIEKGGYVISDSDNPDVLIFATGSEVWVALEVKKLLSDKYKVKVVNLCCWELFEEQEKSYKKY